MKIDRRSFLSLAIGGAAGTALSPLPWKVVDDLSIWSQNWPWTPVPKDGEISYTDSVCTLCPAGCGISVRKIEDRVVKIEGTAGSPVNNGGVCALGLCGPQLLYSPSRIQAPLKRRGERGAGEWETITWGQAIAEVAEKMKALRAQGKPQAVAAVSGTKYGIEADLLQRFLKAYGTPNFIPVPSSQDSYAQTFKMLHGADAMAAFDIENATHVLSFGAGVLDGWASPVRMFRAHSMLVRKNAKLVQIEPRLSNTAAKADPWVPINPGTETDLALGLAYVIIQELLYKRRWVDRNPGGFERFKQFVINGYRPDRVAKVTGVDTAAIISMAREFAGAARPLAICGRGQGDAPGAMAEYAAVHMLNALVGNLNEPGGVWLMPKPDQPDWPDMVIDDTADKGLSAARFDGATTESPARLNRLAQSIQDGYAVELLMVADANPLYTMADVGSVKSAMDKVGMIVSFASVMDETAMHADLILPNHMYLERYTDVPLARGLNQAYHGLAKPVVKPLLHTRYTGDVVLTMAKAMGDTVAQALPWPSYEACLKQSLGKEYAALMAETTVVGNGRPIAPKQFTFALAAFEASAGGKAPEEGFELTLIPYDSMRLANDRIGDPPFMVKIVEDTVLKGKDAYVEINPETAEKLHLAEGKKALLKTPKGEAKVRVHLYDGIMPGVIAMPKGLGHHMANDRFLDGKGVNVNTLIGSVEDPVSGLEATWGIQARLAKL